MPPDQPGSKQEHRQWNPELVDRNPDSVRIIDVIKFFDSRDIVLADHFHLFSNVIGQFGIPGVAFCHGDVRQFKLFLGRKKSSACIRKRNHIFLGGLETLFDTQPVQG